MKISALIAFAAVTSCAGAAASAQDRDPLVTAFVNVNVISMMREAVERGRTVVTEGDRIVAIGSTDATPLHTLLSALR